MTQYATSLDELLSLRAQVDLARIALFPKPAVNADGSFTLGDADENLSAALYDLKRLKADQVCINTIERVLEQLIAARKALAGSNWQSTLPGSGE